MSRISVAASRRSFLGGLAALPILSTGLTGIATPARADRSGADLILIALADLHSPYAALAGIVRAIRDVADSAPGVPMAILLNGDIFERGNAVAKNSEGMADWAFLGALSAMAPVVLNIGNHEVALRADLASVVASAKRLGARVIGSVLDNRSGGFFAPVSTRLTVGTRRIGLIGLAPSDPMVWREAARDPLGLLDAASFAGSTMPTAFAGVDLAVVMSHAGLAADKAILPKLPAGALMIGGHNHLMLEHVENGGLYLHAGCWGESIAVISVGFAGDTPTLTAETVLIDPDGPKDRAIAAIIDAATLAYLPTESREVIGAVPRTLNREDSILFAADAVRRAARADLALLNHSAFGATLRAGDQRVYDLDNFVRFDGDVMVAEVDAATLTTILSRANQGSRTTLDARSGDYVHSDAITPEAGRTYAIAVSDWVAGRQAGFLGVEGLAFSPAPGVRVKAAVRDALRNAA
jgi:5'-nucleotidase/UDP-sugar diphosphatase